jgi:hypothetical protein
MSALASHARGEQLADLLSPSLWPRPPHQQTSGRDTGDPGQWAATTGVLLCPPPITTFCEVVPALASYGWLGLRGPASLARGGVFVCLHTNVSSQAAAEV